MKQKLLIALPRAAFTIMIAWLLFLMVWTALTGLNHRTLIKRQRNVIYNAQQ